MGERVDTDKAEVAKQPVSAGPATPVAKPAQATQSGTDKPGVIDQTASSSSATTVSKPPQGTQSGTAGTTAGTSASEPHAGAPGTQAGPLEHKRPKGNTMCGPDGACVACGLPCDGKQWTHEDCHQSVTDWNKVIDDFVNDWRARGASDAEIQQQWNDTLGQWHAQGLQKDFFDSLEH